MSKDEAAIRELIANWMRASAEGDHEKVLGLMAEDAVFLTPGNPPMRGRKAFAAALKGLGSARIQGESEIREIRVLGDWAWCWTDLVVTVTPEKGEPTRRSGNTLTLFTRENGRWLLARDANMLMTA